jgi:hypothetical protein
MLRRAIFSSPSGRLLERGSIDHAIRVEHDQIDEGFWLKHAAVGKPQAPGRRSVIRFTAAARRAAARAGVDLIFHAYHLDDKCIDVEVGQRRPPTRTFPRNIVDFTQPQEIRDCLREPAQSTQGRRADAN